MDYRELEQLGKLYNYIRTRYLDSAPTTIQKATLTLENNKEIRAYAVYFNSGRVKFINAQDFTGVHDVAAASIGVWFSTAP